MATRALSGVWQSKGVHKTTWTGLLNGDDGAPQTGAQLPNKTVQVLGTFGVGGTIVIQASNDGGTTWHTAQDLQGNNVSFTAAGTKTIGTVADKLRPAVTGGDGTTDLQAYLIEATHGG